MSGKIELKTRIGRSKDPRYSGYVEWYLEVTGEDGVVTTISPRFPEMRQMLIDIMVHEFRNDVTRDRKPDFIKKNVLLNISDRRIFEDAQMIFEDFEMPDIYIKTNRMLPGFTSRRKKSAISYNQKTEESVSSIDSARSETNLKTDNMTVKVI